MSETLLQIICHPLPFRANQRRNVLAIGGFRATLIRFRGTVWKFVWSLKDDLGEAAEGLERERSRDDGQQSRLWIQRWW